jgi:hypothetical protein
MTGFVLSRDGAQKQEITMSDTAISKNTKFLAVSRRNSDTGNGRFLPWVLAVATAALLLHGVPASAQQLSLDQTRAIAKEATIYGFPLVDSYRIQYSYFVDRGSPEFKAPWNTLSNTARVYTPDDRAIQTPNSDTPYSFLGADLRAEPLVLTVPEIEKGRYYSLQFIDMYTFNFAYVGSRATGNGEGRFLLTGPNWERSNAARHQIGHPIGDRIRLRPLPDAALQSG